MFRGRVYPYSQGTEEIRRKKSWHNYFYLFILMWTCMCFHVYKSMCVHQSTASGVAPQELILFLLINQLTSLLIFFRDRISHWPRTHQVSKMASKSLWGSDFPIFPSSGITRTCHQTQSVSHGFHRSMLGLISSVGSTVLAELSLQPLFLLFRVLVDQPQKVAWLFLQNKWQQPRVQKQEIWASLSLQVMGKVTVMMVVVDNDQTIVDTSNKEMSYSV